LCACAEKRAVQLVTNPGPVIDEVSLPSSRSITDMARLCGDNGLGAVGYEFLATSQTTTVAFVAVVKWGPLDQCTR